MQVIAEVEEGENLTPNLQKQGQKEADEMLLSEEEVKGEG